MEKNGQTVRVLDEQGTVIGTTYPKRAKGLVKKCRAEFVSDNEIRLNKQCPTYENMEDNKMDQNQNNRIEKRTNYITVNPREWSKNPHPGNETVFDRFMISNPLSDEVETAAGMVEILAIGQWEWNGASCVVNGFQELEPRTEYHLIFWLNGGENDRSDETCQLQILFTDRNITASREEFIEGICFRLNRGYIKPLKKYKGWELYDIPFTTTDAKYTQCQFVADRAPMAVMPAEEPETYKDLSDIPDPYEAKRPQRHNIIFEDGWPVNKWYSTENLANPKTANLRYDSGFYSDMGPTSEEMQDRMSEMAEEMQDSMSELAEQIRDEILNGIDKEIIGSIRASIHPDN